MSQPGGGFFVPVNGCAASPFGSLTHPEKLALWLSCEYAADNDVAACGLSQASAFG
jgi:hypothetical protein